MNAMDLLKRRLQESMAQKECDNHIETWETEVDGNTTATLIEEEIDKTKERYPEATREQLIAGISHGTGFAIGFAQGVSLAKSQMVASTISQAAASEN